MTAIQDASLKVAAAEERLADLRQSVEVWTGDQTVAIAHDHDPKTGWHKYRITPLPEPPSDWVMRLGEFAYHLRSALNYLVDGLVIANGGTPTKANQFPIWSVDDKPSRAGVSTRLTGVASAPCAVIEQLQPYQRSSRTGPEPLETIASLSNMDKHHRLHAVAVVTAEPGTIQLGLVPDRDIAILGMVPPYPVGNPIGDTELTAFQVEPPEANIEVTVMSPIPIEIVFRNGQTVPMGGLQNLVEVVRGILDQLRPWL